MKKSTEVLAFVLAGGEGRRLAPLTGQVAKPAVPFHTRHRLIDFALSNLCNSGIRAVHVLMQYRPQSVLEHLKGGMQGACGRAGFTIHPIVGGKGGLAAFRGTADAVYQVREMIARSRPEVVAVFSADHIYRMDVRQMIDFHRESGAHATVAALPVSLDAACSFGVMEADPGARIQAFAEKPLQPRPMPGRPDHALVSMGNYLFEPRVLLDALKAVHSCGGTDFGGDLLPALISSHRLMAYDFTTSAIDGLDEECDPHYWRDVGTIDAYFDAHMDTLAPPGGRPSFEVTAPCWPIHGRASNDGAGRGNLIRVRHRPPESLPAGARVKQSILRRGSRVGEGAEILRCVVGEGVEIGAGCRLKNVIVDAGNRVPDGFEAGFDQARDRERLPVSPGGVVVIPRGYFDERSAGFCPSSVTRLIIGPRPGIATPAFARRRAVDPVETRLATGTAGA